jgi:hypothetical protein
MMNCLTKLLHNKIRQIQIQYTIKRKNRLPSNCDVPGRCLYGSSKLIWSIDYCLSLDSNCTFLIARFIAGRSIKPISSIIETSNIITKIIWAPEFHYLKIEMSSMFCPKQLIIYLTELKTQSKEKRIHVWCFTWIKDSVDGHKRNFRGFNSEAAKFFRVRRKN